MIDPVIVEIAKLLSVVAAGYGYVRARLQDVSRRLCHLEREQDELVKRCWSNHGDQPCRTQTRNGAENTRNSIGPLPPEPQRENDIGPRNNIAKDNRHTETETD